MNASRPVLALSWSLFSSAMPHCSQILGFLHCHLVFTPSWLCSSLHVFLHPSLLPPAFISSLYLFLSRVQNDILSTCPFVLLSSLLFCPKPTLELLLGSHFFLPCPHLSPPYWLLSPPFSGQAQPCQGQPPYSTFLPTVQRTKGGGQSPWLCNSGSKSSFGQIWM